MNKNQILNQIEHNTEIYPANIVNWTKTKIINHQKLKRRIISHNDVSYGSVKFHKKTF